MSEYIDPSLRSSGRSRRALQPQSLDMRRSFGWLKAGWQMFIAYPGEWVLMALASLLVLTFSSLFITPIPIIGPMVAPVLLVLLSAGMLHAARRQTEGVTPRFDFLFEGVRRHAGNLVLVGLFFSLPLIFVSLLALLVVGGSLMAGAIAGLLGSAAQAVVAWLGAMLSGLLAVGLLFMAAWAVMLLSLWYAPALIMYDDYAPLDAMRLSWRASVRNFGATIVLLVVLSALSFIALFLAGLGMLVLVPVVIGTLHAAYRDVFGESLQQIAAPSDSAAQ